MTDLPKNMIDLARQHDEVSQDIADYHSFFSRAFNRGYRRYLFRTPKKLAQQWRFLVGSFRDLPETQRWFRAEVLRLAIADSDKTNPFWEIVSHRYPLAALATHLDTKFIGCDWEALHEIHRLRGHINILPTIRPMNVLSALALILTIFGTSVKWDQIKTALSSAEVADDTTSVILIGIAYVALVFALLLTAVSRQQAAARRVDKVLTYLVALRRSKASQGRASNHVAQEPEERKHERG